MSLNSQRITKTAMIAGIYAALTFATFFISFGAIQFRVSEVLTVLPVFTPLAVAGVSVGCLVANLIGALVGANPVGLIDAVFGTAATCISAILTYQIGKIKSKRMKFILAPLPPVLINSVIVGWEISYFFMGAASPQILIINMIYVFIGQFVVCYGLGCILMAVLYKNNLYKKIFA
ncbi:MAG: QueT transporter family protein [Oscillospiraceae bacterium]